MKHLIPLVLFLNVLSLENIFAQEQTQLHEAYNQDVIISIENDSIAAYIMLAEGPNFKETVILLHGLPGNERNLDLAQHLRKEGRNVVYFNYRGSWGSQGEFLYSNCMDDVVSVLDFFSLKENLDKFKIKEDSFILFGHSLGGGIGLLKGASDSRVKKIIALSPFHTLMATRDKKSVDELPGFKNYLDNLIMLNVDSEKFLTNLIQNENEYEITQYNHLLREKNVLILFETGRDEPWLNDLKDIDYVEMETDHDFSSKRTEMINYVANWLGK